MKSIKSRSLLFLVILSLTSFFLNSKNTVVYKGVDCNAYASDVMQIIEDAFGCIEDVATYNLAYSMAVNFCEAVDQ